MTQLSLGWCMPNRWTFQMEPVAQFLQRWLPAGGVIVDPFCGKSMLHTRATHWNDLQLEGGVDAVEYCGGLIAAGVRADCVIFDPPYSPRQLAECYQSIGRECTQADTQTGVLFMNARLRLGELLKPGGIGLSFGWQSSGFGKDWPTMEILLVRHGGPHNDTICVAQRKPNQRELWS